MAHEYPKTDKNVYQILFRGKLNPYWGIWFNDFTLSYIEGDPLFTGSVSGQAALQGILSKIRDPGCSSYSFLSSRERALHNATSNFRYHSESWQNRIQRAGSGGQHQGFWRGTNGRSSLGIRSGCFWAAIGSGK